MKDLKKRSIRGIILTTRGRNCRDRRTITTN